MIEELKEQIKMKLVVRGLGEKANNCVDLILPINDEKELKKLIDIVCDSNSKCSILNYTSNCKIKLDNKIDILELNKKLIELNKLASVDEITSVSEYLDLKKSQSKEYSCKMYKGVSIDEIIDKVKAKDYKFYTNNEYIDSTDKMAIYDNLFYNCEDIPKILKRLYDKIGIFNRFEICEILSLYNNDELVETFAKNGFCISTSTGAIEEIKE